MNKKEISEIRRQFTPERCTATAICSCYVDHEKQKKFVSKQTFLALPEEEQYKYFDIFRHTLAGTFGRQLINMEFPLAQELEGGTQEFLLKLRNTGLEDDALVDSFYDRIIENFQHTENYYIILTHFVYDIPGKSKLGDEMFDASDEVFTYLLLSICPVKMSKAALSYNAHMNCMEDRIRDWVVEMPVTGFIFPAFNDRSTDLHAMVYFKKKPEDAQPDLVEKVFGTVEPMTPKAQQEGFRDVLTTALGDGADYEMLQSFHEHLSGMLEEAKEAPEPLVLSRPELSDVLADCGADEEQLSAFTACYDKVIGEETSLQAVNITNTKKYEVRTPHIRISVDPECIGQVTTRMVDGIQCIVIAADDRVEVNGMDVRTMNKEFLQKSVDKDS